MAEKQATLSIDFLTESIRRKFSMPGNTDNKTIGLELELFPFTPQPSGGCKVSDIINEHLEGSYDLLYSNSLCRCSVFDPDKKLDIPRLNSAAGGIVTFEPGGQIEYSSSANSDLIKVINEVIVHFSELEQILAKKQIHFHFGALNPWESVEEVGLKMRKPRYLAMDRYFSQIGPYGQQMMRLSGSIQVNLDVGDPETAERRWLVSNLISPVFCAIFGNSPFIEGKATGKKSYRTIIWQHLDDSRTGFPHLRIADARNYSFVEQYLQFALNASVFTLPDESGCLGYCEGSISFKNWLKSGYNGFFPTIEDWETHLTTLFPDVRPKGFLESRFIDGQAKPNWAVPAVLTTALVYDSDATEKTIRLLSRYEDNLDKMVVEAAHKGVDAFPDLCRELFEIALNTRQYEIDPILKEYCERFYKHYTEKSFNPADELININSGTVFSAKQYQEYEDRLFDVIQPPSFVATRNASDLATGCEC